jgi:hypothetical protein
VWRLRKLLRTLLRAACGACAEKLYEATLKQLKKEIE